MNEFLELKEDHLLYGREFRTFVNNWIGGGVKHGEYFRVKGQRVDEYGEIEYKAETDSGYIFYFGIEDFMIDLTIYGV